MVGEGHPMATKAATERKSRPLYWDSKLYGTPHGDFTKLGVREQNCARGRKNFGNTAKPRSTDDEPQNSDNVSVIDTPFKITTKDYVPQLAKLEAQFRKQLNAKAEMHRTEKTVLLDAFRKVLHVPRIAAQQKVSTSQFVWFNLGVTVSPMDAAAVFNKYGQDKSGLMPVMVFVEALLVGASRYLVKRSDRVSRGNPFQAGGPGAFDGEILYPQCRKGVYPPSNWDPRLAERSAELPDVELSLDFVYGYSGLYNTAPNLFYTGKDEVVYYTAGVGIKYNKALHSQCFFTGHTDDIACMAVSKDRGLVATGQVVRQGERGPKVLVWEPCVRAPSGAPDPRAERQEMPQRFELELPRGDRGVVAVAFSPGGGRVATVAMDNAHTLYLWDIGPGRRATQRQSDSGGDAIAVSKTANGKPPATYGVVWSPFDDKQLLTFGLKNIKFFSIDENEKGALSLRGFAGRFGNPNPLRAQPPDSNARNVVHTVTAACFASSVSALSGNREGEICAWRRLKGGSWVLQQTTEAHQKGAKERCVDGSWDYSGVRALLLRDDGRTLLSGGADGLVKLWSVDQGKLGPLQRVTPVVLPSQMKEGEQPVKIRALDCLPGEKELVVGTRGCDIYEVTDETRMLIEGHSADVNGLAMSPTHAHIFATACESPKIAIWDISRRKNLRLVEIGRAASSVAWSPDGKQLAIGCLEGGLKVLEFFPSMRQVFWAQVGAKAIEELKYSPCGRYLAVASKEQAVDLFNAADGFAKVGRCMGHSSTVKHIDWSQDSKVLQTTDTARELLYFNPRTCRQVKENQRDTRWATWTLTCGFPVMGIWRETSDTTDINACDRSPCQKYLVASDDRGKVRLYNYPCVVENAPAREYLGHSSHVAKIRFSCNGNFVVSVGGHDRAVFQWRVRREERPPPEPLQVPWVHYGGNEWGPEQPDGAEAQRLTAPGKQRGGPREITHGCPPARPRQHRNASQIQLG
uniref:Echinoderm microtubule-associated 6 n=1 Tax=Tetraselmis sp. GSL018 TaxID=582737 RepID=A0A061QZA5_9CHLO